MTWKSWITGIAGLWLALAGLVPFGPQGNLWNDVLVGVLAGTAGFAMARTHPLRGWLAGLLGLWLVLAVAFPAVLSGNGHFWNNLLVGGALASCGFTARGAGRPPIWTITPLEGLHRHQH